MITQGRKNILKGREGNNVEGVNDSLFYLNLAIWNYERIFNS